MSKDSKGALLINGLRYITNFIDKELEEKLITYFDDIKEWNTSLSRRTLHFGYTYDYKSRSTAEVTTPIPDIVKDVISKMMKAKILMFEPDQVIVNEYLPGQGINHHVDSITAFEDGIVSLSLGSDIVMEFTNRIDHDETYEIMLNRRSLIIMHKDARYKYTHGIPARKKDNKVARKRRISLTFRKTRIEDKNKRMRLIKT